MTDDNKNLDDLPSITPDAEDVSSYRRGSRTEAPKQSNFNGILMFVIVINFISYYGYKILSMMSYLLKVS